MTGAIDGGDHDIAEHDEGDGGGDDEPGDLLQAGGEARAELGGDLFRSPQCRGHGGQLRGGDSHAEERDGKLVDDLRVAEGGDRAGGQGAGEDLIYEGAQLHHAAADEDREKIVDDGPYVLGPEGGLPLEGAEQSQDRRDLYEELQRGADDRADRQSDREARLGD